jgi:ribosomal-protein-alanine N-acetyltransferase
MSGRSEFPIELARIGDARAIAELSRSSIEYGLEWSWTPARVRRCIRAHDINVIVARHGADLAGFGIMRYLDEEAHLLLLAVRPGCRRRGVGAMLLGWLEAAARVAGMRCIRVEARAANAAAAAFYRHAGYIRIARVPGLYQGKVDGALLRKWLWTTAWRESANPPA